MWGKKKIIGGHCHSTIIPLEGTTVNIIAHVLYISKAIPCFSTNQFYNELVIVIHQFRRDGILTMLL